MPNYSQSKIYKIVNSIDESFYIGSTINQLSKRFGQHKAGASKNNSPFYRHANDIGWDNFRIILIEECGDIQNKDQLLRREDEYIVKYKDNKNCLNKLKAFTSKEERMTYLQEYREEHTEKYKEHGIKQNKIKTTCPTCKREYVKKHHIRHSKSHLCRSSQTETEDD